ncbi:MAG: PEP-CTERM sorting domain-containing protein [Verrucomicrobiota bacterium]
MKFLSYSIAAGLACAPVHATLDGLPTPIDQGGMIHAMVTFRDQPTDTFSVMLHGVTPELNPISIWSPGEDFSPSDPWYSQLDPAALAKPFGSRYGILVDGVNSDFTPAGTSLGIRVTDIDPGLTGYFYSAVPGSQRFDAVLAASGSEVLWNGNMWHPVFVADGPGTFNVTLEFFVANQSNSSFVTAADVDNAPGFSTESLTLTMTAVPEPSTYALMAGTVCMGFVWLRRRSRK